MFNNLSISEQQEADDLKDIIDKLGDNLTDSIVSPLLERLFDLNDKDSMIRKQREAQMARKIRELGDAYPHLMTVPDQYRADIIAKMAANEVDREDMRNAN